MNVNITPSSLQKLWVTFIADTAVTNDLNGHTTSQTLPPWFQGIINSWGWKQLFDKTIVQPLMCTTRICVKTTDQWLIIHYSSEKLSLCLLAHDKNIHYADKIPSTPKIWLLILPSKCWTFPCKLVTRLNKCYIKITTSSWSAFVILLPVCWIMYGYYREKLHVNHFWE